MKPSAFDPGGKFTFTETCEWFDGRLGAGQATVDLTGD